MKRNIGIIGFLASALTLSGCGFVPQDSFRASTLKCIHLSPYEPYSPFHQALEQRLDEYGVLVVRKGQQTPNGTCPSLHIDSHSMASQALAYSPTGEVRREQLTLTVEYSLESSTDNKLGSQSSVKAIRDRLLNDTAEHADEFEKEVLEDEMQNDAFRQLIQQLDATLKSHAN